MFVSGILRRLARSWIVLALAWVALSTGMAAAASIVISPTTLPNPTAAAYSHNLLIASGGTGFYSFAVTAGSLPSGMSLNGAGALSGTPTAAGTFNFTVGVTDEALDEVQQPYTFQVLPPTLAMTPSSPTLSASVGVAFSQSFTASGGTPTYTYWLSVTSGTMPAGLSFNASTGTLSGTPTSAGIANIAITAADSTTGSGSPFSVTRNYTLQATAPTILLSPSSLPNARVAVAYSQTFSASGGTGPYSFSLTAGALPLGMTLSSAGVLSGTPTAAGTFNFTVRATDNNSFTSSQAYSLTVGAPVLNLSPSGTSLSGVAGVPFSQSFSASQGTAPYTYALSVTAGTMPAGLVFNAVAGTLFGTPTAAGSASFSVTATDSSTGTGAPFFIANAYTLTVSPSAASFVFAPASGALPQAMAGEAYGAQITATGGAAPLLYSLTGGSLPPGLTLNVSTGALNGPLDTGTEGDYSFTIGVTDANSATGSANYTLRVSGRVVAVSDKSLTVPAGSTPTNVRLDDGATGGPFTAADIVSLEPANAGAVSIVRGEFAAAGPGPGPAGWYLKFVPRSGFSGPAQVKYRLISSLGASNVAAVNYNIGLDAPAVARDMQERVTGFVQSRMGMIESTISIPGLIERRGAAPAGMGVSPSADGVALNFSASLAQMQAFEDMEAGVVNAEPSRFNAWIDGTFMVHNRAQNGDLWGTFAMISAGADFLLSEKALVGFSLHYDRMTDPTATDESLSGNGWLAGPYASIELGEGVFWNTSVLYGGSDNDIDTAFWDGGFQTERRLINTSLSGNWQIDEVTTLTPRLNVIYLSETVKGYAITNAAGDVIAIDGFDAEQLRIGLGADISRRFTLENGAILTPRLGLTGGVKPLDGGGWYGSASAGLSLQMPQAWTIDGSAMINFDSTGSTAVGAKVGVKGGF